MALDGTKLAANAADKANRTHDQLDAEVAEILRQAAETDQREDRLFGGARGDELPPGLATKADRLARLRQAKAQLEAEAAAREQAYQQRVAAHAAAAPLSDRRGGVRGHRAAGDRISGTHRHEQVLHFACPSAVR